MNKYAMMMAKMAYNMPKVAPVSPDKSDRIFDMINGNTDSVAKWFPPETYAKYKDFDKTAAETPVVGKHERAVRDAAAANSGVTGAELLYTLLGAAGGGGLGYWLGGLGDGNKKNRKRRLMAALLGAGTGGLGINVALDALKDQEGHSFRHELRGATADQALLEAARNKDIGNKTWNSLKDSAKSLEAKGGGLLGALLGLRGWGFDISGRRLADNLIDTAQGKALPALPNNPGWRLKWAYNLASKQTPVQINGGPTPRYVGRYNKVLEPARLTAMGKDVAGNALIGWLGGTAANQAEKHMFGGTLSDFTKFLGDALKHRI